MYVRSFIYVNDVTKLARFISQTSKKRSLQTVLTNWNNKSGLRIFNTWKIFNFENNLRNAA
jgi:hypothetical protein